MYKSSRVLRYPCGPTWSDYHRTCDEGRERGRRLGFFTRSIVVVSYNFVDVYGRPAKPCPYESDIAIDTGNMQDSTDSAPSQDDLNLSVPAASEEVKGTASFTRVFFQLYSSTCTLTYVLYWSDAGATEPLNDAGDDDEEADDCDATDGDGVITEVPAPEPVLEARARVPTTT
ncbi:Hypothetical predicted protein [Olea europaea subsp. europaea]|uniref:Uncharacterized protein n=1 Tax=Olea europaea subsp. europaea TaxID=158383 RepID=A0A8S0S3Z8_OLEEU|nr:Hypothetical predicted protein [Olea europaea subsp. europaea]